MRRRVWVVGVAALALSLGVWRRLTSFGEADSDELLKFTPPAAKSRQAAIGDIRQLSRLLQRVFDPAEDFAPLAELVPTLRVGTRVSTLCVAVGCADFE